jgi:hypothetical protein
MGVNFVACVCARLYILVTKLSTLVKIEVKFVSLNHVAVVLRSEVWTTVATFNMKSLSSAESYMLRQHSTFCESKKTKNNKLET